MMRIVALDGTTLVSFSAARRSGWRTDCIGVACGGGRGVGIVVDVVVVAVAAITVVVSGGGCDTS